MRISKAVKTATSFSILRDDFMGLIFFLKKQMIYFIRHDEFCYVHKTTYIPRDIPL